MTAGRKPVATPEIIDVEATQDLSRISNAVTVMRHDAQDEQQRTLNEVLSLGTDIGIVFLSRANKNINAVAEIKAFERINKSKAFKHIEIPGEDGIPRLAENIDDFCRAVFGGRGYKAMSDQKQMLDKLGEETYESAKRLGLNRSQLRLLINLPEDTRDAVEEAMQSGSKSDVVTLIQSLANQLDEAKAKTEELKAEVAAKETRIAVKSELVDAAEEKARGFKLLSHDEQVDALLAEATNLTNAALTAINGRFRQALVALENHGQSTSGTKDFRPLAAGLVGQLQQAITIIRDEFMLADIIGDGTPEWMRATAHLIDGE